MLLGASETAVKQWEETACQPPVDRREAITRFVGFDPFVLPDDFDSHAAGTQ